MKKVGMTLLSACCVATLLSCGGGGSEGDPNLTGKPFGRRATGQPTFTGSTVTGLIGIVVDSSTGTPIANVAVAAGGLNTVTDANGNFAMPTIPNGASVVSFNIASHAPQSRTVVITSGIETSVIMLMTPNATTAALDPAAGGTINSGTAQLVAAAGALALSDGSAPAAGNGSVILTSLPTA